MAGIGSPPYWIHYETGSLLVILSAALRLPKNLIGLDNLLDLFLILILIGVALKFVGMVLFYKSPIGTFDFICTR